MRELIWALVAVLFGYAAFQLIRALRMTARKGDVAPERIDDAARTTAAATSDSSPSRADDALVTAAAATPWSDASVSVASRAGAGGDAFQRTLEVQQLRHELARVQEDFSRQNEQILRLETDLAVLREQLESVVASQGVSPEYNEALVFARRGLAVDAIAERCGISVAEAELVRSLAQGGTNKQEDV